jgi:hypothetical protein
MWLFTPRVSLAFQSWVVPLLGFFLLPFTTLAYVMVWSPLGGISFGGWLLMLGGLLFDLGTYALGAFVARSRRLESSRQ